MDNNRITYFAKTTFRKTGRMFGIKSKDRRQHVYVIGKTGAGKTCLLENMALQDVQNGEGLAIIDPHGGFVSDVLDKIPSHRVNDVVYFNPADTEYPIAFNVLEVPNPKYKHLVASGLMSVFTKIWANVWSARMEYILSNCILALLDTPGTTLLGLNRILVDREYRQKIIDNVKDPVVKSFWVNEYSLWREDYRNEAIAPIQNKVGQFLNVSLIRNIVGQSKSTINIQEIMDSGKILLADVSKGRIGEDNSSLLGAMLINKIQLVAMERVRVPEEKRRDFYLYVDEFQNFVTESFANILSEARKYHLNLIIAHQYIGQLVTDTSTKVRDAVFGNAGTLITFRVGAADAEFLEKEFSPEFEIQDLVRLPNFNIYLKLMIDGITSRPFSAQTLPPISIGGRENQREKIIRASRERYSVPREKVEERIARWSGILEKPTVLPQGSGRLYDAVCSLCGKKIKVPFPPDKSRPIYCKSCLKKIESGKISVSFRKKGKGKPISEEERRGYSGLSDLGIEFGHSLPKPKTAPREEEARRDIPTPISLEELRKERPARKNNHHHLKKGPNIEELRRTLKESLKKFNEQKDD